MSSQLLSLSSTGAAIAGLRRKCSTSLQRYFVIKLSIVGILQLKLLKGSL